MKRILFTTFLGFLSLTLTSCLSNKNQASEVTEGKFADSGKKDDPDKNCTDLEISSGNCGGQTTTTLPGNSTTTSTTTTTLKDPGSGEAPGCDGQAGSICLGGFDDDPNGPQDLKVNVVYSSSGRALTNDPDAHAKDFLKKMNDNFIYKGHRYINLIFNKTIVDTNGLSDDQLVSKYAEDGYVVMILVDEIPGDTAGYVQNSCAKIENGEAWTVFEFDLVDAGVVEHESLHIFCFPHTSSQNGRTRRFFLPGYNSMKDVLENKRRYKRNIDQMFNIFVDGNNNSDRKYTHDGMKFWTRNVMYYSIYRSNRPKLFEDDNGDAIGFPYSYTHLLHYYYNEFIKGKAK